MDALSTDTKFSSKAWNTSRELSKKLIMGAGVVLALGIGSGLLGLDPISSFLYSGAGILAVAALGVAILGAIISGGAKLFELGQSAFAPNTLRA